MSLMKLGISDQKLFGYIWEFACRALSWKGREEARLTDKIMGKLEAISTVLSPEEFIDGMEEEVGEDGKKTGVKRKLEDFPEFPRKRILTYSPVEILFYKVEIDFFNKSLDQLGGGAVPARPVVKVMDWLESGKEYEPPKEAKPKARAAE